MPERDPARPEGARVDPLRVVRSSLRRYPAQLAASLKKPEAGGAHDRAEILNALGPMPFGVGWLGHASVLATLGERVVAVDPVLSDRVGPRVGPRTLGVGRLEPAPVRASALRGVDLVLITHAHFDHLDRATLAGMADERTTVVVPRRCAGLVPRGFGSVREVDAGEGLLVLGMEVRAHAPRHWGARAWFDRGRGCCAYEVRHDAGSVLFAGDTAYTDAFHGVAGIDLAVFGIGAYDPWEHMHATPEQVWRMFTAMGASRLLPVHHSTFELSDEPRGEPMERLLACADAGRLVMPELGVVRAIPGAS